MHQAKIRQEEGGAINLSSLLQEFEGHSNVYEKRGLFTTKWVYDPKYIIENKLRFKFSLFQIPALVLDYFFRRKINSLNEFLKVIPESRIQFSEQKMKQTDKTEVSIPLYEFLVAYSTYCCKNGYLEIQSIETVEKATFKNFGLNIETFDQKKQPAYIHLRKKTNKELNETDLNIIDWDNPSSVSLFLKVKCVFSQFDTDYISFEELNALYLLFCKGQGIPESQREQIIGNEEVLKFGGIVKPMAPPARIAGIKKGKAEKTTKEQMMNSVDYSIGLVRKKISAAASLKTKLLSMALSVDGVLANGLLAFIHFMLILIVPLVTPFVTYLALCEMTTLQGDVFGRPNTFYDFYSTNRLDPWWETTPYITTVAYIHIYVLVYLFFAYVELTSFYITGTAN